jgi:predicted transcriptional regulator
LSDIQRGKIVVANLAGSSATKTATLLSVSRAAVSKVMTAHTNYGKTSSTERNSGRNPKRSERDRRKLKRKTLFPQKKKEKLHKSNINSRDVNVKILITENNAKR